MPHDPEAHKRIDGLIDDVAALKAMHADVTEIKGDVAAIKNALAPKGWGGIVELVTQPRVAGLVFSILTATAASGWFGRAIADAVAKQAATTTIVAPEITAPTEP